MKIRSEEHTSELQSRLHLVCRLLLEKKNKHKKKQKTKTGCKIVVASIEPMLEQCGKPSLAYSTTRVKPNMVKGEQHLNHMEIAKELFFWDAGGQLVATRDRP